MRSYVLDDETDVNIDWKAKKERLEQRWNLKLLEREKQREQERDKRKEKKAPSQNVDVFLCKFRSLIRSVALDLVEAEQEVNDKKLENSGLTERFNKMQISLREIQMEVAQAAIYLPPYDLQQATKEISKIEEQIENARVNLAPRKKFAFSSKGKKKNMVAKVKGDSVAQKLVSTNLAEMHLSRELVYENIFSETVVIKDLDQSQDLRLNKMENCTIWILDSISALRCVSLKSCRIYSGPVAGSCFVEGAIDCSFYVASRQVRIHDSNSCDFYINVCSRPIIEYCEKLRFAKYTLEFPNLTELLEKNNLKENQNQYDRVDDFRWLRQQKSPNWCLIPDNEIKIVDASTHGLFVLKK